MGYSEFFVDTAAGSNLSAGAPVGGIYPVTSTNGAYTQAGGAGGTDRFTASSGTPFSSIAIGDFVSIYADAASAPTGFVGRVTAFTSTTLDISLTAIAGTRPTTVASGRTAVVGGAWLGPTGASGFPFGFITAALVSAAGDVPRVNGKGTSNITAAMTHALAGPVVFQGMTATPGDGGKWTIDGGTSGVGYVLLTTNATSIRVQDLILQNNGASGTSNGLNLNGTNNVAIRVVVHDVRGNGFNGGSIQYLEECEAYNCNQNNNGNSGGFNMQQAHMVRCIAHDNTGSNNSGFVVGNSALLIDCIADSNGSEGLRYTTGAGEQFVSLINCDFYANGSNGVRLSNSSGIVVLDVENCNFLKNGGVGIFGTGAGTRFGRVVNCGFGSGTQANTSGTTSGLGSTEITGSITYAADVTPWVDPANGDFRINLAAAKGTGRGNFTQTQGGYAGTVASVDVGAGQHKDTGGLPLGRLVGGL